MRGSSFDMLVNSHDRTKAVHIMPFSQVHQITKDAEYQILSILFWQNMHYAILKVL